MNKQILFESFNLKEIAALKWTIYWCDRKPPGRTLQSRCRY